MTVRTVLYRLIPRTGRLLRPVTMARSSSCFSSITTPIPLSYSSLCRKQPVALLCTQAKPKPKTVTVTYTDRDGNEHAVQAKIGDSLMEVAKKHDLDLEGACEGTLACSTCHLIVDKDWYNKIPDPLTEEEEDMLDLAYAVTDTSRLGCQILVTEQLDGIKLKLPAATRDARNL